MELRARFRGILGAAVLPQIREPYWTTTMCCLDTAPEPLSQAGLQSNQRDYAPAPHVINGSEGASSQGVAGENPRAGCCVYRDDSRNKHRELDQHGRPFV